MEQDQQEVQIEQVSQDSKSRTPLLVLGALLLIGISVLGTLFATDQFSSKNDEQSQTSENEPVSEPTVVVKDESDKDENKDDDEVDTNASWQVAALTQTPDIFVDLDSYYLDTYGDASGTSYVQTFKLGDLEDGREVLAIESPVYGLGQSQGFLIALASSTGSYSLLAQDSSSPFIFEQDGELTYNGPTLKANASVDLEARLPGLVFEENFTYNGQGFVSQFISPDLLKTVDPQPEATVDVEVTKLGQAGGGTLYEIRSFPGKERGQEYALSGFLLKLPSGLTQSYAITGELTREKIDPIIWNDGQENADDFLSAGRGCSVFSVGAEVALRVTSDDLTQIGSSKQGQTIFGFKDINHPLHLLHYEEYQSGEEWVEEQYRGVTLEQFFEQHGTYLVEDGLGRMLVFSNQNFVPPLGCAKPVVYLYPETPTTLDVEVGADVTISEPQYEEDGWQDVTAFPDGSLEYRGESYESLFWEGYGHGAYPEVNKGFVVHTFDAVNVWENHLERLGMIEKEIADFTEFWEEKIPSTPYVRISWLGTQDLEQLAPLKISEKYDTLIRVFMDMEGLQEPIEIEEQQLGAIERKGFTVTEWGGLARDGSVPRLQ